MDAEANTMTVFRAAADPVPEQIDVAARALMPAGVDLGYARARFSRTQVDELNALVASLLPELDAEGARVTAWGQWSRILPSYAAPYVLGYEPGGAVPSRRLQAMFDRFGEGSVRFREGGAANLAHWYQP